jgi:UDP-GlcNAc:undecaprenyl-phosphate GlcNAc-1-phosphate transferase
MALFSGACIIFIVGLIDDAKGLSAGFRIFVQLVAATLLVANDLKISFLPNSWWGDLLEIVITYVWILGITNAFNYLDGVDALCGGIAVIAAFFFAVVLAGTGQHKLLVLCLGIMGACLGFIPHNVKRAKMFLGDSGSMMLGFLLAGISLIGNFAAGDILKITVPILILGVPIFDMIFTTIMRIKEKKVRNVVQWFEYAGRDHFHHYLMDLGLRGGGTVIFIFLVNVTLGISAYLISKSTNVVDGVLMLFKSSMTFALIAVLMVLGRRIHKEREVHDRMGI